MAWRISLTLIADDPLGFNSQNIRIKDPLSCSPGCQVHPGSRGIVDLRAGHSGKELGPTQGASGSLWQNR